MGLFSFGTKNKQETVRDSGHFVKDDDAAYTEQARSKRATSAGEGGRRTSRTTRGDPILPEKKRARRRLVGAIALVLAAVVAVAYLVLLHWWWTAPMLAMGDEIAKLRNEELALSMEIAQRPDLERELARVREFEAGNPGFLPETNKQLATAALVQRLESVVAAASPQPGQWAWKCWRILSRATAVGGRREIVSARLQPPGPSGTSTRCQASQARRSSILSWGATGPPGP